MSHEATKPDGTPRAWLGSPAVQQLLVLIGIVLVWQAVSGPVINAYYLSTPVAVLRQIASWIPDALSDAALSDNSFARRVDGK